jgi:protein involved in polysaccharide export with SLBB domain
MRLLIFCIVLTLTWADETKVEQEQPQKEEIVVENEVRVFGHNLFNGSFSSNDHYRYNANYLINIGDVIDLKLWGAHDFTQQLTVDSQGNIFIPKVGTVKVLGLENKRLSQEIEKSIKRIYKTNVYVYADLVKYQPVSVFVTGAVNKPGLYEGLSSDSIIQFLDKAKGINSSTGSYRFINILRNNSVLKSVDLYEFLEKGKLNLFQFQMGDVIVVESIKYYLNVKGDVKRPYRFELKDKEIESHKLFSMVLPNATATNFLIREWNLNNQQEASLHALDEMLILKNGQEVEVIQDHINQFIEIAITGEHANVKNIVIKKGTTLAEVMKQINISSLSEIDSFQLYRKSVAKQQKMLIDASLKDLETKAVTTPSMTSEEAVIRQQEAKLVMNFIERAKQVEPKGLVVINEHTDLDQIILEERDSIYIPKKSYMVVIEGEVMLPGAQTYVASMGFDDYIRSCGGFSYKADQEKVLIIHQNGQVSPYDSTALFEDEVVIHPGDSILVLGEVDSKYIQVVKDMTQIMYQIAVGASVVLRAN